MFKISVYHNLLSITTKYERPAYNIELTVKNNTKCSIKNFSIKESLVGPNGFMMVIINSVSSECNIVPINENTPNEIIDAGHLLDHRVSILKGCSSFTLSYTLVDISTDILQHNNISSIVSVGKCNKVYKVSSLKLSNPELNALSINSTLCTIIGNNPDCLEIVGNLIGKNTRYLLENGIVVDLYWNLKPGTKNQYISLNYVTIGGVVTCISGRGTGIIIQDLNIENISGKYPYDNTTNITVKDLPEHYRINYLKLCTMRKLIINGPSILCSNSEYKYYFSLPNGTYSINLSYLPDETITITVDNDDLCEIIYIPEPNTFDTFNINIIATNISNNLIYEGTINNILIRTLNPIIEITGDKTLNNDINPSATFIATIDSRYNNLSYQWYYNNNIIENKTSEILKIYNTGLYILKVKDNILNCEYEKSFEVIEKLINNDNRILCSVMEYVYKFNLENGTYDINGIIEKLNINSINYNDIILTNVNIDNQIINVPFVPPENEYDDINIYFTFTNNITKNIYYSVINNILIRTLNPIIKIIGDKTLNNDIIPSATFIATIDTKYNNLSYQWYYYNNIIVNNNDIQITVYNTGIYKLVANNNNCSYSKFFIVENKLNILRSSYYDDYNNEICINNSGDVDFEIQNIHNDITWTVNETDYISNKLKYGIDDKLNRNLSISAKYTNNDNTYYGQKMYNIFTPIITITTTITDNTNYYSATYELDENDENITCRWMCGSLTVSTDFGNVIKCNYENNNNLSFMSFILYNIYGCNKMILINDY